ncbi:MAG: hypothetical protein ACI89X_003833 [Planctomycetota bacterium]
MVWAPSVCAQGAGDRGKQGEVVLRIPFVEGERQSLRSKNICIRDRLAPLRLLQRAME